MTKKLPQNIYDNPEFFQGYRALRKGEQGFNALIEQPAIRSLLPNITGRKIIDLGCGFGNFCRYLRQQGASSVLGVDVSEKMLAIAQHETNDEAIQYRKCAIEDFSAPDATIDLVISSLALHYIADYQAISKKIYSWLKSDGYLIFSVEHPMCTAHPNCELIKNENETIIWPIDNYRDEGQFSQTWFVDNVIKYHRTIETYINRLIECGFTIQKLSEPMPSDELIAQKPEFAIHKIRPALLLIRAYKG